MRFSSKAFFQTTKSLLTLVVMLVYGFGAIEFEGLHEALHAEEHTAELEQNPCHRTVFHQDLDACQHTSHIAEQKNCLLCHLMIHADGEPEASVLPSCAQWPQVVKYHLASAPIDVLHQRYAGRAPPVAA